MPENRYYIDEELIQGELLLLPKEELAHLRVMRKKPGDQIEIVNGRNTLAQAVLKASNTAQITSTFTKAPPKKKVILIQAFLRPKNLDLVIEKGTELGAAEFWLFPGEKGGKRELTQNYRARLHYLTISALKQCGRLDLPPIVEKPPLKEWEKPPIPFFYGDPDSKALLTPIDSMAFVIGPESGFSPLEVECLQGLKAQSILLSTNTLRAETAALCALAKSI